MTHVMDVPRAVGRLGKRGPLPQDPSIVLMKGRDWVSKNGKVHVGKKFWYVVGLGRPFSTKCPENDRQGAEAVLAVQIRAQRIGLIGEHAPDGLTFAEVLDDDLAQTKKLAIKPSHKRLARLHEYQHDACSKVSES